MKIFWSDECIGCLNVACFWKKKSCFARPSRRPFIRAIFIRTLTFRIVAGEKSRPRPNRKLSSRFSDRWAETVLADVNAQARPYPRRARDIGIRGRKKAMGLRAVTSYIYASLIHSETKWRQYDVKATRYILRKLRRSLSCFRASFVCVASDVRASVRSMFVKILNIARETAGKENGGIAGARKLLQTRYRVRERHVASPVKYFPDHGQMRWFDVNDSASGWVALNTTTARAREDSCIIRKEWARK